jgi:hypothetical protein
MEIQFTIKLLGSGRSAAVLTNERGDNVVEGISLGKHKESAEKHERPGKGGEGDPLGSGGGGTGMGQVIVIGPIVISGAAWRPNDAGVGGEGDPLGSGGGQGER